MVSKPDTRQCASEEVEPQRGVDTRWCASTLGPEEGWIGGLYIDWRRERVSARMLGLEGRWIVRSHIRWTRGGVLARTLPRRGVDWGVPHRLEKGTSASEDVGTRRKVDCEIPRRVDTRGVPTRTLGPEGGWIGGFHIDWRMGTSASEDAGSRRKVDCEIPRRVDTRGVPTRTLGPEGGWIGGFHIDWRRERVPARTLGPEGRWIVRSHIGWEGERNILHKGVETFH